MSEPRVERPGLYYPKLPTTWWLRNTNYFLFMLRELSSVFIMVFLVLFLVELYRLSQGPKAYGAYLETLRAPGWIVFHVVALAFALYHSVTWFKLSGVVQVVRMGERQVPPSLVTAASFALWAVVSIVLLWFMVRG